MADVDARESFQQVGSEDELGGGAYFWVYSNQDVVKDWTVTFSQGNWTGSISSDQQPPSLKTDGLSGEFDVRVEWRQPPNEVVVDLPACSGCQPNIGCNDNCGSMVLIDASDPEHPCYCTTWDAICKPS